MNIKCAIIDDEPLAIDLLKSYVNQTSFLELAGTFNNPVSASTLLHSSDVQLLFLDINMPDINGLEFSKILPPHIKIIFTTAYDQFAVESFRLNALDYLLKPINYPEFIQASTKALQWFKMSHNTDRQQSIFIKSGYRIEKINLENILYIENRRDYVNFHLEGIAEPICSLMNIQSLDDQLPSDMFMRVHRSFIVHLQKVQTIERNRIIFDKTYIPISETYKSKFMDFLNKYFFKE